MTKLAAVQKKLVAISSVTILVSIGSAFAIFGLAILLILQTQDDYESLNRNSGGGLITWPIIELILTFGGGASISTVVILFEWRIRQSLSVSSDRVSENTSLQPTTNSSQSTSDHSNLQMSTISTYEPQLENQA